MLSLENGHSLFHLRCFAGTLLGLDGMLVNRGNEGKSEIPPDM